MFSIIDTDAVSIFNRIIYYSRVRRTATRIHNAYALQTRTPTVYKTHEGVLIMNRLTIKTNNKYTTPVIHTHIDAIYYPENFRSPEVSINMRVYEERLRRFVKK